MKLQDHINSTDLDMTEAQVKAFFLGTLCAEKPMPFAKALEEILSETPEAKAVLEAPLKETFTHVQKNLKAELESMFPKEDNIEQFVELAKDQLDYFLTGMALAGTNTENCEDEGLAELIDELEDSVEDMEDWLSDSEANDQDGEDFKEFLLDAWKEFSDSK